MRKNIINIIYVSIGSVASAGAAFIAQALMARNITPSDFGQFMSNLAILNIVTPLAAFGLPQFLLRINGKFKGSLKRWNEGIVKLSLAMSLIAMLVIFSLVLQSSNEKDIFLLLIMSPTIIAIGFSSIVTATKQIEFDFKSTMLWQASNNIFRLASVIVVANIASINDNVTFYGVGYGFVSIVIVLLSFLLIWKFKNKYKKEIKYRIVPIITIFKMTWMYGAEGFVYLMYYSMPIILTRQYLGNEAAGLVAISNSIISAVCLIPVAIHQRFLLPKLHYESYHFKNEMIKKFNNNIKINFLIGIIMTLAILFFSKDLIKHIYGANYGSAIQLLMIHALILPFRFAAYPADGLLGTKTYQKSKLIIMLIQLVLCLIFVSIGAFSYGLTGVIVAIITCEIAYFVFVNKAVYDFSKG